MINPIEILLNIWDMMQNLVSNLYDFLFTDATFLGYTFKPFYLIGSTVLIVLLVAYIVKLVTPIV
jgi:hypothetical protein